jgi:cation:H+ antiporter
MKGSADITIGNIVGSNIMNILIILGLSSVITPLAVAKSTVKVEIPFVIFITLVLLALGWDGAITFMDGIILWALFIAYLAYLFVLAKKQQALGGPEEEEEEKKPLSLPKALLLIIIGMGLIILGSNLAVEGATGIARFFGLSERFIGLTIVALGTSLPELVTSVAAARKKAADIAIGNIVGSNIFNILFVVGTSSLIIPIPFASAFRIDMAVAAAVALLLLVCCAPKKRLNRISGILMLVCYVLYFVLVCM